MRLRKDFDDYRFLLTARCWTRHGHDGWWWVTLPTSGWPPCQPWHLIGGYLGAIRNRAIATAQAEKSEEWSHPHLKPPTVIAPAEIFVEDLHFFRAHDARGWTFADLARESQRAEDELLGE